MKNRFVSRTFSVVVAIVLAGARPGSAQNSNSGSATGIENARVVWMKNQLREAVVSWSTREPGKQHRVYHHVHLSGLKPATTYYLVMVSDNTCLAFHGASSHWVTIGRSEGKTC